MDTGPLDVLHYPGDKDGLPVTNGINLHLFPLEVFINEHRVSGIQFHGQFEVAE